MPTWSPRGGRSLPGGTTWLLGPAENGSPMPPLEIACSCSIRLLLVLVPPVWLQSGRKAREPVDPTRDASDAPPSMGRNCWALRAVADSRLACLVALKGPSSEKGASCSAWPAPSCFAFIWRDCARRSTAIAGRPKSRPNATAKAYGSSPSQKGTTTDRPLSSFTVSRKSSALTLDSIFTLFQCPQAVLPMRQTMEFVTEPGPFNSFLSKIPIIDLK